MTKTAVEIATSVRAGTSSARAEIAAALDRIDRSQPQIGAWQVVRRDKALAEADAVDARIDRVALPLAGVPVAIKDNIPVKGEPMRDGARGSAASLQTSDHEVVRRLRSAGAVVVGLTRVPELCIWGATDSSFGITRNPWALDRTPGGSSGGTAAAVASGDVPIGHGNDGMGSIRIPAACCGLVGLKPGLGVVPSGLGATNWNDMAENGPLATTVEDAALLFSVLADDPSYAVVKDPARLRIAVSTRAPAAGTPVAAAWRGATDHIGDLLGSLHAVHRATPRYPASLMTTTALQLWTTGAAQDAGLLADAGLLTGSRSLERRNRVHVGIGRALLKRGYPRAAGRESWRVRATEFFDDVDVLITPSLAQPPIAARDWNRASWAASLWANARYAPFAAPWNIIGWPAMTVPAGLDDHGRPVGVQLVGRPGSERTLLALAAQIEGLEPWQRTAVL